MSTLDLIEEDLEGLNLQGMFKTLLVIHKQNTKEIIAVKEPLYVMTVYKIWQALLKMHSSHHPLCALFALLILHALLYTSLIISAWVQGRNNEINSKISIYYRMLAVVRKLKHLAPFAVRNQLLVCLIISKINYDVVSHLIPDYLLKHLKHVQLAAASFVL